MLKKNIRHINVTEKKKKSFVFIDEPNHRQDIKYTADKNDITHTSTQ